jgi:Flp pilus assembly protein TadG
MDANTKKGLRHDQRGAVLAEFVVVLFPLLMVFFTMIQLSAFATAKLMTKHAAVIASRAAAVYSNQHDNLPEGQGDGRSEATAAARAAIGTWSQKQLTISSVTVSDASSRSDDDGQYGLVTVTVSANYQCTVPMARFVCGLTGSKTITETKSMPHQGARYRK